MIKKSFVSFVSRIGKHTPNSLGNDINTKSFINSLKSNSDLSSKLGASNSFHTSLRALTDGMRLIGTMKDVHTGLIHNGENGGTNGHESLIPFVSNHETSSLGKNDAKYFKSFTHLGKPTGSRIKNIQSGPFIETVERLLSSSSRDYINHRERQQLEFKCGFNEKGFSFLLEDTYMSVYDYNTLFEVDKNYKKLLENEDMEGKKDIYGCILNSKNKLILKNRLDYFTCHVKIHLIKITDQEMDVRELVENITHNSSSLSFNKAGKIPIEQQYSTPKFIETNKFSINFLTSLDCNLKLATRFQERAKIVKTWTRTLSPGSIWEFNLTHHLGRGLHINRIYDIQSLKNDSKNLKFNENFLEKLGQVTNETRAKQIKEEFASLEPQKGGKMQSKHPTGYIYCLEFVGDRRSSVINKQGDYFTGYSPVHFNMEFNTKLRYLEDENSNLLVYKKSRQSDQFESESEFGDIFYPNRQSPFHLSFEELFSTKKSQKNSFEMVYDQALKTTSDVPNVFNDFVQKLTEYGINLGNITSDDLDLDFTTDPSEPEEYEGTGGNPPT